MNFLSASMYTMLESFSPTPAFGREKLRALEGMLVVAAVAGALWKLI